VTKALYVRHLRAHFGSFAIFLHPIGLKLTTKNTKDTENFASPQCSGSARVSRVGDDVSSSLDFCEKIVSARRRNQHARRVRYPETEVNA
jgi:hypothetical protein